MGSISWNDTAATGTVLHEYQFPRDLFLQKVINDKIQNFRLFRGGIRLTLRLASNRFLYGKLIVSWEPMSHNNPYSANSTQPYVASGYPHILVSATASEAAILDIPFISNKRALDLASYLNDEIGHVEVTVLNPLVDINGDPASAKILVTAQFVNAEAMIPCSQNIPLPVPRQKTTLHPQSKQNTEASKKSSSGVISSTLEALKPISALLHNVPFVAPFASVYSSIASPVAGIFKMFGLSKPTTEAIVSLTKINPFSDLSYGKGIDTTMKLSMDPENQISTEPVVGGIPVDEMNLDYIFGTPVMVSSISIAHTDLKPQILSHGNTTSAFVDFISSHMAYASGSYKFKLYITASMFHAARAVIYLAMESTDLWEECYHKVIDIQGDTEVEFTIPYVGATAAYIRTQEKPNPYVMMQLLSVSVPDATIPAPIYVNVYKAGGSDFKVGMLTESARLYPNPTTLRDGTSIVLQSNPRADFNKMFEPLHPSMTGYDQQNLLYGEHYTTLREIIHRYHPYKECSSTEEIRPYDTLGITYDSGRRAFTGLEFFGLIFKFFRGSIRMKFIPKINEYATMYTHNTFCGTILGVANSSPMNPVLEAEIPWYTNDLFAETLAPVVDKEGAAKLPIVKISGSNKYLLKAAGDDFSFHFLRGIHTGLTVQSSTTGTIAYYNFMNS